MRTSVVQIRDHDYLRIEVVPVCQKTKTFYLANMPARFLLETYTAEPAKYDIAKETALAATFEDDENYFSYRLDQDRKRAQSQDFERKLDWKRVKAIGKFLGEREYALFPNTIIVTCDLMNDVVPLPASVTLRDVERRHDEGAPGLAFLEEGETADGLSVLYVPRQPNSILVIDGQHRLKGLEEAGEPLTDHYDLLVSFVIGFSRSAVAELFYTINYEQKSVNKSLLYHLSGEFSRELDEITFMHETVRMLNELAESPFYRRIKMLGRVDERLSMPEKARMTISQAFLIDYLLSTILKGAKKSIYPPIFLHYYRDEQQRIEIVRFLMRYFSAIRELRTHDWDNPDRSILCNTLGIGALIKVLHFLFVKMFVEEFNEDPLEIRNVKIETLIQKLKGIEDIDFSKEGEFGGGASAGGLNRLTQELVVKLPYFEASDYDEFREHYKNNYLPQYRHWLARDR